MSFGVVSVTAETDCSLTVPLSATVVSGKTTFGRFLEPPFQFIHTMDLSVVDMMLHDSPDLVIHRSGLFGGHSLDARKFVVV